jgi:hypothetical protein
MYCSAHECGGGGFEVTASNIHNIDWIFCESSNNGDDGIKISGTSSNCLILHCTSDDNSDNGLQFTNSVKKLYVMNNQFSNNSSNGIDNGNDPDVSYIDYNNYFFNGTAKSNTVWPALNETTNDPDYDDDANRDYSGVDDADAYVMQMGVG